MIFLRQVQRENPHPPKPPNSLCLKGEFDQASIFLGIRPGGENTTRLLAARRWALDGSALIF